jgi:hypothetical protein
MQHQLNSILKSIVAWFAAVIIPEMRFRAATVRGSFQAWFFTASSAPSIAAKPISAATC